MRKVCDRDFKFKVAKAIKSGSRTVTEVAGKFRIFKSTVPRWLAEFVSLLKQGLHRSRDQVTGPS
jgi:transposase-like protein